MGESARPTAPPPLLAPCDPCNLASLCRGPLMQIQACRRAGVHVDRLFLFFFSMSFITTYVHTLFRTPGGKEGGKKGSGDLVRKSAPTDAHKGGRREVKSFDLDHHLTSYIAIKHHWPCTRCGCRHRTVRISVLLVLKLAVYCSYIGVIRNERRIS